MKNLNKTEYGIPDWPEFNEYSDGYTVKGFCRELVDESVMTILVMLGFFAGMMLIGTLHTATSDLFGVGLPGVFILPLLIGPPVACYYYLSRRYGKDVSVIFTRKYIRIEGKVTGKFPVLNDQVAFRMLPHRKIRMHKRVQKNEVEKLQDYGEIVLEYGLETYAVCNIANLWQAQVFTRVLNEAFKRSQALEQTPQAITASKSHTIDPDDLPE